MSFVVIAGSHSRPAVRTIFRSFPPQMGNSRVASRVPIHFTFVAVGFLLWAGRGCGSRPRCGRRPWRGCRCRSRRRSWCSAARRCVSNFQPIGESSLETREGRGTHPGAAGLHAPDFPAAVISVSPIEDVKETWCVLVEPHFKIRRATETKISCAPFNIEFPVRRSARDRGENPAATGKIHTVGYLIGTQVAVIRQNCLVQKAIRQGTECAILS